VTLSDLLTRFQSVIGLFGPDARLETRFMSALRLAVNEFARLGMRYYRMDNLEIDLPGPATYAIAAKLSDTSVQLGAAPEPKYYLEGAIKLGSTWRTIRGIDGDKVYFTPAWTGTGTSCELASGGFSFRGDHGIAAYVGGAIKTDWSLAKVRGVQGLEMKAPGLFSTRWKETGTPQYWAQRDQALVVAPWPSADTVLYANIERAPVIPATYSGSEPVDFPDDLADELLIGVVYFYKLMSEDPDLSRWEAELRGHRGAGGAISRVRSAQAALTGDVFSTVRGIRYIGGR